MPCGAGSTSGWSRRARGAADRGRLFGRPVFAVPRRHPRHHRLGPSTSCGSGRRCRAPGRCCRTLERGCRTGRDTRYVTPTVLHPSPRLRSSQNLVFRAVPRLPARPLRPAQRPREASPSTTTRPSTPKSRGSAGCTRRSTPCAPPAPTSTAKRTTPSRKTSSTGRCATSTRRSCGPARAFATQATRTSATDDRSAAARRDGPPPRIPVRDRDERVTSPAKRWILGRWKR